MCEWPGICVEVRGRLAIVLSFLPPLVGLSDQSQVVSLEGKHLYLPRHHTGLLVVLKHVRLCLQRKHGMVLLRFLSAELSCCFNI